MDEKGPGTSERPTPVWVFALLALVSLGVMAFVATCNGSQRMPR